MQITPRIINILPHETKRNNLYRVGVPSPLSLRTIFCRSRKVRKNPGPYLPSIRISFLLPLTFIRDPNLRGMRGMKRAPI